MPEKPKFKRIHFDKLRLDAQNPRLPRSFKDKSEAEIIEFMLLDAATLELMQAIGENNYFEGEQLLVVEDDKNKKNFIVVEGNRRLTSVKLLSNPDLATVQKSKVLKVYEEAEFQPKEIPCLVFKNKDDILNYLGYRHITGVKSWRLLEKARYLYELKEKTFSEETFSEACRELAKMIGSRRDYIERITAGFEVYKVIEDNAFYRIRGLDDTNFYFNYLADGLNRPNIKSFIGVNFEKENPTGNLNHINLKKLATWFFQKNEQGKTRVKGDSTGLNKLDKVLGNEEALEAFESGVSIEDAYELTSGLEEIFESRIYKSISNLEKADQLTHKVKEFYPGLIDDLLIIRKLTKKIKDFKENIEEDEF